MRWEEEREKVVRNLSPNEKRKRRTSQSMEIDREEEWGAVRQVGEQKIRGGQAGSRRQSSLERKPVTSDLGDSSGL
jgi:hypothetical protein